MGMRSTERADGAPATANTRAGAKVNRMGLVVVERRDFLRGCLNHWLNQFCDEFQPVTVADVETAAVDDAARQAAAVLIGVGRAEWADQWVSRQVKWLRENCPQVPIALLVEAPDGDELSTAVTMANQLGVQACITTSTSLTVAVAALRLVAAGGQYFPNVPHPAQASDTASVNVVRPGRPGERCEKLTPREQAVMSILAVGAQNKIIAYKLGMSMSTVKAHMHSIIRKLQVRNRTEAVVAVRAMELMRGANGPGYLDKAA
jgi:DNA-binding NarL/FixJ family response regulator